MYQSREKVSSRLLDDSLCGYARSEMVRRKLRVLYGVMPEFRGMGVYRDLIRATVDLFMRADSPTTICLNAGGTHGRPASLGHRRLFLDPELLYYPPELG